MTVVSPLATLAVFLIGAAAAMALAELRALYDRCAGRALAVALHLLHDRAEAEDVVQETFLELWRRSSSYDPSRGSRETWAVLVARSRALDVLAQRSGAAPSGRWAIALGFGLVHGFGFAGALAGLGLPRAHLASALFSFNLGVELGQAAIVAVAFPALLLLSRRPAFVSTGIPAASTALGCAGLVWLVQRLGA